jgi:hypothetical protein
MSIEDIKEIDPIEAQANCEELPTLVMFRRLDNPTIRKQVEDMIYKGGEYSILLDPEIDGNVESWLDHTIFREKRRTMVSLDPNQISYGNAIEGHAVVSPLCAINNSDEAPTVKQNAITEAHEKGHAIRPYHNRILDEYFSKALDHGEIINNWPGSNEPDYDPEMDDFWANYDVNVSLFMYITSPAEIAERMGQLKNYFGMDGDQAFTKEHLEYAREHYVEDTGMDNNMTLFFAGITPATLDKFLEVINSAGI